jgi:hypothetical protein
MYVLGTVLFLVNAIVFSAIGFVIMVRLREAKGSLLRAKISIAMSVFSAAAAFLLETISQLVYDPADLENLMVKKLFVPMNLFAMLVIAFLASFAIFATYSDRGRKLIVLLIFAVALTPTAYMAWTYDLLTVAEATPYIPESFRVNVPDPAMILFALCAVPVGLIPLVAFGRSYIMARRRGDKVLSRRGATMFSAVLLNMVAYLMFLLPIPILRLVSLIVFIPSELFLLFAVLRITSQVKPET